MANAIALTVCLGLVGGCKNRRVFPEDATLSPYDRYYILRDQSRPLTETNEFGRERPALRSRLLPDAGR